MQEIVLEMNEAGEYGVPQHETAQESQSSAWGLIIAYGLFFFSLALSGA